MSPSHPLAPIAWADGARPSPASLLVWGLGLRRRRVPPAVAPVGESVAQSLGEPVVGAASVMRSTAPPYRKAGHVGSLSGQAARIIARRTLLWSSGAANPPGGTSRFPPFLRRSTASKGRFLIPLVVPELAQLSLPYTSTTRGRASDPRRSGTVSQSRSQGRPPPAPRAGSPCGQSACGTGAAPRPPPRRGSGNPRRLRPRHGGGWLALGSGGLGGDEVSGVGVDVVEVGLVVVVVVGVVCQHLLDAGGDASHRLHVRLWGRPAPRPRPFAPPSPPWLLCPVLSVPGAHGTLALAHGSLPGPNAPVPLSVPWVPLPVTHALACTIGARAHPVPVPMPLAAPTLADRAPLRRMRSVAARLRTLVAPLRVLPVRLPLHGSLSRVAPSAARALSPSAAAGLGALPVFLPSLLAVCALACPLSPPVPRNALLWTAPCPACAPSPPSRITRRASCCCRSCGSVTPGGERSGAGGRTCRVRPEGKAASGGYRFGGLVWVWLRLAWGRYSAPSLPLAAAAAATGEAPRARAVSVPRACGVPGAAAWPAGAVARLARAAVPTPCALSPPPSAAAVTRGETPGACAGATPCAGGAPGAANGAAAWLVGAAVSAPCAPGAPSRGSAAGLAAWAAGAVSSAGAGPRVDGPVSAEAAWGCSAGGPTVTAASASLRSLRSARVSPAYPGETGERERDRRWWRLSRWGESSESDITVILVGMGGDRCALPTTSWCICVVPWAVLCSAPRGGRGEGMGGWRWC